MRSYFEKLAFLAVLALVALAANVAEERIPFTPPQIEASNPQALTASMKDSMPFRTQESLGEPLGALVATERFPHAFHRVRGGSEPIPSARVALVGDLRTGEVYFAHHADERWPMASITKLMTAVLADDKLDARTPVSLGEQDFSVLGGDVSRNLKEGETYLAEDLIRAMLLFSSNESAEALANAYGRDQFLSELNVLAGDWGMHATHFSDPTGLSAGNQSTAKDLFRFAQNIEGMYPELLGITRMKSGVLNELSSGRKVEVSNINAFAGQPSFLGGKTGYTDEAKGNLLSIFEYADRPIVIIVMGTEDRFGETEKLRSWFIGNFKLNG